MSEISCDCHDVTLIRRQREEIVLLTKELNDQQEELMELERQGNKWKGQIKTVEKEKNDLQSRIKCLNKEIEHFKDEMNKKNEIIEQLKLKVSQKDSFIQSQVKKLQQSQAECEKLKSGNSQLEKSNKELKTENNRLKQNLKDQCKRVLDLKEKMIEMARTIDSKARLLHISTDQIKILEKNLSSVAEELARLREAKKNIVPDIVECENTSRSNNEKDILSAIQDLKETWTESNMQYKELRDTVLSVTSKCDKELTWCEPERPSSNENIKKSSSLLVENQISNLIENRTSTPIINY